MLHFLLPLFVFLLTYYLILKVFQSNDNFWPSRGIPLITYRQVTSFFKFYFTKEITTLELELRYYNVIKNLNLKYGGMMELRTPVLLVADMDLAKQIMVQDFEYFVNHRDVRAHTTETLFHKILFNLVDQEWKTVRKALNSIFNTSKMAGLIINFNQTGRRLVTFINSQRECKQPSIGFEMNELSTRYTLDAIASSFGIQTNCLANENYKLDFCRMFRNSQGQSALAMFKRWLVINLPRIAKAVGVTIFQTEMAQHLSILIKNEMDKRKISERKNCDDLLQYMLNIQEQGVKSKSIQDLFTDEFIIAHSASIFFAAVEAPAPLLTYSAYMLAIYPEIQENLVNEVDKVFNKTDGVTFDALVHNLPYMDSFVSEVLRMFPPASRTERVCTKDYILKDSGISIPRGTLISIPICALQNDDRYFEDPHKFDPLRFSLGKKATSLSAFGYGPRNCIGGRLALFEIKVALAHLVHNFIFMPSENHSSVTSKFLHRDGLILTLHSRHIRTVNSTCIELKKCT